MSSEQILFGKLTCLTLVVTLSLLAGCGNDDSSDLNKYIEDVKLRPKEQIEPLPAHKSPEPFKFEPANSRNPFGPEKPEEPTCSKGESCMPPPPGEDPERSRQELEAFPLERLKMVGTVNEKSNLWGLIKSDDKTIHRVRVGNYMGQNYGKIVSIASDRIELIELIYEQQTGRWREQQTPIKLTDELGG